MPIYWFIFALSLMMFFSENVLLHPTDRITHNSLEFYRKERIIAFITFVPLLIFLSVRDYALDTYAYVYMFKELPFTFEGLKYYIERGNSSGAGFIYLAGLFKIFIINNYYWWFAFLALINLWCIYKVCIKNSPNLALSIYLFIAGTTFTWCLNGTRQFLAVTLLFYASKLLLNDKRLWYIIVIYLCSLIHRTAIFLIPIGLIISKKNLYDKWMLLVVLATLIGVQFSNQVMDQAMELMGKQYDLEESKGANILRLLFNCIPVAISLIKLRTVKAIAPPAIILGLNMCLVGTCFMFVATFTSGILVGRMPAYFNIFGLYVLPWLLYNCFGQSRALIINMIVGIYAIWFYYQMCVAWHGLTYVSNALEIYYW